MAYLRQKVSENAGKHLAGGVVWLSRPREKLTPGQASMGKGAETVLEAIRSDLERRGVRIRRV